jgi:hypothetical protein
MTFSSIVLYCYIIIIVLYMYVVCVCVYYTIVVQLFEHWHREHGNRSDKSHQPEPAIQPGRQSIVVFGRWQRRRQ